MKEFIAAAVLIGIVVYFWFNASPEPPPELRERHRPATATTATPANNPTLSASNPRAAANADGSLATRWPKGPNAQTDLTTTPPDRWKPGQSSSGCGTAEAVAASYSLSVISYSRARSTR